MLDLWRRRKGGRPLDSRPRTPRRHFTRRPTPSSPPHLQLASRESRMTPHRQSRGVGQIWGRTGAHDPCRCTGSSWSVDGVRLPLSHGNEVNGCGSWEQGRAGRASSSQGRTDSERFGCCADAWFSVGDRRSDRTAGAAGGVGGCWGCVLGDVLGGWSSAFVGTARRPADDEAVSELRQDRGVGGVAWGRCGASLVCVSEWAGCDASGGEADRADGCSEHGLDVVVGVHAERPCQVGVGGDKGCE